MNTQAKPIIMQPGMGKELSAFGNVLTVMLAGEQTGETIMVASEWTSPGGGPPPHIHQNEDEIFLVIEGRIHYFLDGKGVEVEPGGLIYLPKGVIHSYRNIGTTPSRHWIITTPSGFERFFERCAGEFENVNGPDKDRVIGIHREHGIHLVEADNP